MVVVGRAAPKQSERIAWRLSEEDWASVLREWGYPGYYSKLIWKWLWQKGLADPTAYTDLPKALREKLLHTYEWPLLKLITSRDSQDGTRKFLWEMPAGGQVESVWIPQRQRATLCISSQVGCSLNCRFCATGQLGLERNLEDYEIYLQYHAVRHQLGLPITNIVYMGMGEPLLNFSAVVGSVGFLTVGAGLSSRRLTISTVGIPKGIRRLAEMDLAIELAVSLHSAIEEKRRELIPLAARIGLEELREALGYYCERRRDWITIEYVLLEGVNDGAADAAALRAFVTPPIRAKVNLIVYNPVPGLPFRPSGRMQAFRQMLLRAGLITTIRRSRGSDIAAGCGQLARRYGLKE
jgi:23S rRNA (adenine2503-C2)-methyltransferase